MKIKVNKECYLGDALRQPGDIFEWDCLKKTDIPSYIVILEPEAGEEKKSPAKMPPAKNSQ